MGVVDFVPLLWGPWSVGVWFVEGVKGGHDIDWVNHFMAGDQADHVLAALGLFQMPVVVVVDDANDEYEAEVSDALIS